MNDPKIAIEAVLESEKQISDKITVHPLTLARYALLELVESPFLTPNKEFTPLNLLDTFYIMAAEKSELRKYHIKNIDELHAEAMDFGEELEPAVFAKLIDEVAAKFGLLNKIAPQSVGNEDGVVKKKS